MIRLIKFLFLFLGSVLIGFGLCLVMVDFIKNQFSGVSYMLIYCGTLIAGGFFLGLSFIIRRQKVSDKKLKEEKKKIGEEKEEKDSKEPAKEPSEIINNF